MRLSQNDNGINSLKNMIKICVDCKGKVPGIRWQSLGVQTVDMITTIKNRSDLSTS